MIQPFQIGDQVLLAGAVYRIAGPIGICEHARYGSLGVDRVGYVGYPVEPLSGDARASWVRASSLRPQVAWEYDRVLLCWKPSHWQKAPS